MSSIPQSSTNRERILSKLKSLLDPYRISDEIIDYVETKKIQWGVHSSTDKSLLKVLLHYYVEHKFEKKAIALFNTGFLGKDKEILSKAVEANMTDFVTLLLQNDYKCSKYYQSFREAIINKNHIILKLLLTKSKSELNQTTNSNSLLHEAVEDSSLECAKVLLDCKINYTKDGYQDTPILIAARRGQADIFKLLLLNHPKRLLEKDSNGLSTLHLAAANGHVDIVKCILETDPSAANWRDEAGRTPLMFAALNNHSDVVNLLIESKANLKTTDLKGYNALHYACSSNSADAASALIAAGISLKSKKSLLTPLQLVCRNNIPYHFHKAPEYMIKGIADEKVDLDMVRIAKLLLESNADKNDVDEDGNTLIHYAVSHSVELTELLLKHGANPLLKNESGETAIFQAFNIYDKNIVDILEALIHAADGDINEPNNVGTTPFEEALNRGAEKAALFLIDKIDIEERDELNILGKASTLSSSKVLEALLNKGIAITPRRATSMLPSTVIHHSLENVRFLVEKGANVNIQTSNSSLIDLAFEQGRDQIVAYLHSRGARLSPHFARERDGINDAQSVHEPWVHLEGAISANALEKHYEGSDFEQAEKELKTWSKTLLKKNDNKSKVAAKAIKWLLESDYSDERADVSTRDALLLVWLGVNDKNAIKNKTLTQKDIEQRRNQMIESLYFNRREYNIEENNNRKDKGGEDSVSCPPGAFLKVIGILSAITEGVEHQCVHIPRNNGAIMTGKLLHFADQAFSELPVAHKQLARDWQEGDGMPDALLEKLKPLIQAKYDAFIDNELASVARSHILETYEGDSEKADGMLVELDKVVAAEKKSIAEGRPSLEEKPVLDHLNEAGLSTALFPNVMAYKATPPEKAASISHAFDKSKQNGNAERKTSRFCCPRILRRGL